MTKKKVEVNEEVLKNIIVGDIPVFGREKPAEENAKQPEPEVPPVTESANSSSEKAVSAKPPSRAASVGSAPVINSSSVPA